MSKLRPEFNAEAILKNEENTTATYTQITYLGGNKRTDYADINVCDTFNHCFFSNQLNLFPPHEPLQLPKREIINNLSNYEQARHYQITLNQEAANKALTAAYNNRDIQRIKSSATTLTREGVPEVIANYFRGAFHLRIGETQTARDLLSIAATEGDCRISMQYLYLALTQNNPEEISTIIDQLEQKGDLNRYVILDACMRAFHEDKNFTAPITLTHELNKKGHTDIAQAILAQIVTNHSAITVFHQNPDLLLPALKTYTEVVETLAPTHPDFKIPLALAYLDRANYPDAMNVIDSMPEDHLGRAYLELMMELHRSFKKGAKYVPNKYAQNANSNRQVIQTPSNLYAQADQIALTKFSLVKHKL